MTVVSEVQCNLKSVMSSGTECVSPFTRDDEVKSGRLLSRDDSVSLYEDAEDAGPTATSHQTPAAQGMEQASEGERLKSLQKILDLFFDNHISEAEMLVEKQAAVSTNHSHVRMYFTAMSAMLTLDPVSPELRAALDA